MNQIFRMSIFLLVMVACNQPIRKTVIKIKKVPDEVLIIYRDKVGLVSLQIDNEYVFELRKWDLFDRTSTYPTLLERHFLENGNFKTEYFIFSNKMGGKIKSKEELDDLNCVKFETVFPPNLYDSLMIKYNLSQIEDYPTTLDPINDYSTFDRINIFYEERREAEYRALYVINPLTIVDSSFKVERIRGLMNFCWDSILMSKPTLKDSVFNELKNVFGK